MQWDQVKHRDVSFENIRSLDFVFSILPLASAKHLGIEVSVVIRLLQKSQHQTLGITECVSKLGMK